jgi:hypothetical protein
MHSSSPPFVLHALPTSFSLRSQLYGLFIAEELGEKSLFLSSGLISAFLMFIRQGLNFGLSDVGKRGKLFIPMQMIKLFYKLFLSNTAKVYLKGVVHFKVRL